MKDSVGQKSNHFHKVAEVLQGLPVGDVAPQVINSVQSGNVTVLTGETGSGKTLLASSLLADASDHQVVVLVPRRFLAINAAEKIAEMCGLQVGKEVGYAVGRQSGGVSNYDENTKLVFATYGYALRSGMLHSAKTVVCDEVHEAGIDTSIARAILHRRLEHDKSLHVLEMSATLNAPKQAAYWEDIAKTELFHAKGPPHPCEYRQEKELGVPEVVKELIVADRKRQATLGAGGKVPDAKYAPITGIAVFKPGVKEVEKTAAAIQKLLRDSKIDNVEVAFIHGNMSDEKRREQIEPPKPGNVKILVGTNVIESGINIDWLTAGVSDGLTKIPYYRPSGAEALITEEMPKWRIIQQMGRINRKGHVQKSGLGQFILCSQKGLDERPVENSAEISRMSLNSLVMHAAGYHIDPTGLKYDAPIETSGLPRAREELMRLGLLTEDWKLTEKGEFVHSLPLGVEAGTMMWQAPKDIMGDVIELAAMADSRGLRADFRSPFGMDERSDILDSLKMFKKIGYGATEEQCAEANVSWKQYEDAITLIDDIHRRMGTDRGMNFRRAGDHELIQLMLQGSVNKLFEMRDGKFNHLITGRSGYEAGDGTVTEKNYDRFAIANLREIPQRTGIPRVIVNDITKVSKEDLCAFAARTPEVLTDMSFNRNEKGRDNFTVKYFGGTPITINIPKQTTKEMRSLIEPAYSRFAAEQDAAHPEQKPRGKDNTEIWDEQKRRTDEKRKKRKGGRGGGEGE